MIKNLVALIFLQFSFVVNTLDLSILRPIQNKMLSLSVAGATCYLIHNYTPIFVKNKDGFVHLQEGDMSYLSYEAKQTEESDQAYVFAHGFRASGFSRNVIYIAKNNPTGKCYSTHFEDARTRKIFRTSLGQDADICDLIKLLQILSRTHTALHIIGHSRGAATVINSITVLRQENHPLLVAIGINEETRQEILTKICKGSILLKAPLLDIDYMYKKYFTRPLGPLVHYLCSALTCFRYKPWGYQPIKTIESWEGLPVKVLVCLAKKDSVVGNALDQTFINKITTAVPGTDIFFYEGDHGDHPEDYCKKINDFYTR